jgi:GAF domain-containing protein
VRNIASGPASRAEKARHIADAIRRSGDHRWVGIYDVSATEIAALAWSGPAAPAYPRFPVDKGLSGSAVVSRRTIIANDVSKDPRYLATLGNTGSEMIVPVMKDGRAVGTIDIESERTGRFTDSDRSFVEDCARAIRPLWDSA